MKQKVKNAQNIKMGEQSSTTEINADIVANINSVVNDLKEQITELKNLINEIRKDN